MYFFFREELPGDASRRIVQEKISESLSLLQQREADPVLAVHEVRKNIKRVRALLRLFRDVIDETDFRTLNLAWRDLGRTLSGLRDQAVLVETLDQIFPEPVDAIVDVRARLVGERDAAYAAWLENRADVDRLMDGFAAQGEVWAKAASDWNGADLEAGFVRAAGRVAKAFRRVETSPDSPEIFHEWRKRVKDWWYHHELLQELAIGEGQEFQSRMHQFDHLSDLLGLAHDAAVFEAYILELKWVNLRDERQIAFFRLDQEAAALAHGGKLFSR